MTNPAKHSDPDGAAIAPHTLATAEPMSPITPEAVERLSAGFKRMCDTPNISFHYREDAELVREAAQAFEALLSTLQAVRGENEELTKRLDVVRESLRDQAAARLDPDMPLLTPEVLEALRGDAEAAYALADTRADRVQAHGLSLLCDWQDRARQALSTIQNGGGEGGDFNADLSSAKRADHDGERSDGWREAARDLTTALADERDYTIAMRTALTSAREYVVDALEAYEHSDGRDLLGQIDKLLSPSVHNTLSGPQSSEGEGT